MSPHRADMIIESGISPLGELPGRQVAAQISHLDSFGAVRYQLLANVLRKRDILDPFVHPRTANGVQRGKDGRILLLLGLMGLDLDDRLGAFLRPGDSQKGDGNACQ